MRNQLNQASAQDDPFAELFAAIDLFSEELRQVLTKLSHTEAPQNRVFRQQQSAQVLELKPAQRKNHGRIPKGAKTPAEAFFIPILSALAESEGRLTKQQILVELEFKMKHKLNQFDLGRNHSNGIPKWHSNVDQARRKLLSRGLLAAGTSKSVWEISAKGREWVQKRL